MQDALTGAFATPRSRNAGAAAAARQPSFVQTLQAAFEVFARHPLHVTFWAMACFASVGIIGSLLYAAMIGDAVIRTGSHSSITMTAYNVQMLVQALIGAITWQLGRGAITWIALQAPHTPITLRATLGAVLREWGPLLASALLYGALITIGLIGLSVLLREMRLDVTNARWARGDMNSVLHWTNVRAIAALPPDAGSPFADWFSAVRYNLARAGGNSPYFGFEISNYLARSVSPQAVLIGTTAIMLLFVTETVLCMRTAGIFSPGRGPGCGPGRETNWLKATLDVSATHFWRVAGWRWALRLALALIVIGALILPPALHQAMLMNEVRRAIGAGGYWPYHIAQSAYGVGAALVSSFLLAFGIAFEARMFAALALAVRSGPLVRAPLQ